MTQSFSLFEKVKICIILTFVFLFGSAWFLLYSFYPLISLNISNTIPLTAYNIIDSDMKYNQYLSHHPELLQRFNDLGNDNIIYSNPLSNPQCNKAIIYKENINIHQLLNQTLKYCQIVLITVSIYQISTI